MHSISIDVGSGKFFYQLEEPFYLLIVLKNLLVFDVVGYGCLLSYLQFMFYFQRGRGLERTSCCRQGICFTILIPWDGFDVKSIKKVINYVPHIVPVGHHPWVFALILLSNLLYHKF